MLKGFIKTTTIIIYCVVISGMICDLPSPDKALGANSAQYQSSPPFVTAGVPPLLMLVMGRNHKLYYEAYNDASDLNEDGELDIGYNPNIDYYGYFDSYKYYQYSSNRFEPVGETSDKKAPAGDYWSGDFLNYLTMTRMDCLRKVLYGGYRSTDTATETVLERVFVPQDGHSWGKEYYSVAYDGYDIRDYTPLDLPAANSRHLFASTTLDQNGNNDGADDPPLLRVLENSVFRIWEWVAIERPVAGSQGNDGSGRRDVTDNDVSGTFVDVTDSGSAGVIDDSFSGSGSAVVSDGFNDGSIDPAWSFADHDDHSSTSHSESGGELIIDANGNDVWTGHDEFASLYINDIAGDFDFKLSITQQENSDNWAKCGIMVRNDMTQHGASTGYCMMSITPGNGYSFQWDSDDNGYLNQNTNSGSVTPPAWVRLTKQGNTFKGFYSSDGASWTELDSDTIGSANTTQDVGIFVTSHTSSDLSECRFDQMEVIAGVEPAPELAFDDNDTTEWIYPDEPGSGDDPWIEFDFDTAMEIKAYTINGGDDAPDDWTLQGSNDQTNWTTLDSVTSAGLISGDSTTFECDSSAIYEYYRLVVSDTSDPGTAGFSIKEIEMMETTEPIPSSATLTDYEVRVEVCDTSVGVEENTKQYPSGVHKPIGILQRHGEADQMYFGLITGSYTKNLSGGVLRNNISSISNEIDSDTGEFLYKDDNTVGGIINTIDKLRIIGFDYSSHTYNENCGLITTHSLNQGECRMWGNPTAEMMYETLRYFAGKQNPTAEFDYDGSDSGLDDNRLDLPKPSWDDPYSNYDYCAKPFMLVLSDIYPTYDSDQLPGSRWEATISDTLSNLDVESSADTISSEEGDIDSNDFYIGRSGDTYNGACTPKTVAGLGSIRGLCPEEPTKQGSYYAASVAYHGNITDLHSATGEQTTGTYSVGLSSPLPQINIEVGDKTITLIPFAKSVGGNSINAAEGEFQPTNTIVDFFVEEISATYGKFRINFEDVEQGNDHDMDAIVEYEYQVTDASGNPVADPANGEKVTIDLNSTYAAGSVKHHLGYIMSGSSKDGTYLVVRDEDTSEGNDPDYFLDTPPGEDPDGNWDDNTHLPLTSSREFEPGSTTAASDLTNPLWYAAKWGGFEDYNNNDKPDQASEWDKDEDGTPDTYFYVQNPLRLEEQLNKSFTDILRRTSSGTAASVISQTRSGEGAVYQAVFFPEYKGPMGNTVSWTGAVHSLFVDAWGNMREDTNDNDTLDLAVDRIVEFNDTVVEKYEDDDGDGDISGQTPIFSGTINDIEFLWTSSEWLNEMSDTDIIQQRDPYNDHTDGQRFIFTFVDQDQNMVADTGEQVAFEAFTEPSASDLTDPAEIFPYMNIFPTFGDEPSIYFDGSLTPIGTFRSSASQFEDFLKRQSQRVVNYIRGKDFLSPEDSGTTPEYTLPPFRSRQADYDDDGILETWRLGDIIYSTPTVVGRPAEGYHLLYRDASYGEFLNAFKDRRQVIYTGANDGMFHAFNGGFYDSSDKKFKMSEDLDGDGTDDAAEFELGAELWAYVPYNLLPHLYWLTETTYPHVYYCDLKPKVFDAKILPDDTHYSDSDSDPNWGTFLVAGMRFGGGEVVADMDKTDGGSVQIGDRTMTSAYFILDITDPESEPEVIAELSLEHMGYTTCYPAVIPMKDKDDSGINENEWYLIFGSGPADAGGEAGVLDSLDKAVSSQEGKLYVLDLKALAKDGDLKTLDSSGAFTQAPATAPAVDYYQSLDANSFISDPVSVDYNLDFSADAVYFGTVEGDSASGWGGKLRRVVTDNDLTTSNWNGDSTLANVGQPIVAAPNVGIDDKGKRWVYFGTGRFFVDSDKSNSDQQSYYGIIEPFTDSDSDGVMDSGEIMTWSAVDPTSQLVDVTTAAVYDDKTVENVSDLSGSSLGTWDSLLNEMDSFSTDGGGWYIDFQTPKERNLGQAALFGELLTFTTYVPSTDPCQFQGESNLYALYYKTGTPYYEDVIGYTHDDKDSDTDVDEGEKKMKKKISLGDGLAVTPNIHAGKSKGSKAFVQKSTGDIQVIEQINPGATKSGVSSWREMEN